MDLNFSFGKSLQQASQQIENKYSPISKKLDSNSEFNFDEHNERGIRDIVDNFMSDMVKLKSKLDAKGKGLEPAQHKNLEFIAKQLDEVSGVGRGGGELFSARESMSKIFNSFHFDKSTRNW